MGKWFENLSIGWMSLVVFGLVYLGSAAIFAAIIRFAGGERSRIFKGLSPGMLPPLGIIFGLFVAFVAAQVSGTMRIALTPPSTWKRMRLVRSYSSRPAFQDSQRLDCGS